MVKKKDNKYSNRNFYLVIGTSSVALLALLVLAFNLSSDGTIAGEAILLPPADWCNDTDGGIDLMEGGYVQAGFPNNNLITRYDECKDSVILVEYKCASGNRIKGVFANCANDGMICVDGACVEDSCPDADADGYCEIDTCGTTITSSGNYELYTNLNCIYGGIIIEADDVTLDCKGYTVTGDGDFGDYGLYLNNVSNVVVSDCNFNDFYWGVYLSSSYNNILSGITVSDSSSDGIYLDHSYDNSLGGNTISGCNGNGISFGYSDNNILMGTTISNSQLSGINFYGTSESSNFNGNSACNNNLANGITYSDFRCNADSVTGNGNTFDTISACDDGWPVLGVDYSECP